MPSDAAGPANRETSPTEKRIVWYALMVHPYVEEVQKGVIGYERDTGIKIKRQIGQNWTQDNENANVEPLAAQGYKGFSIYPADASAATDSTRNWCKMGPMSSAMEHRRRCRRLLRFAWRPM